MGSSILGGFSSTLAGTGISDFVLDLKKSPTRAERRRPTLGDFGFSSFFSSFCEEIRSINFSIRNRHTFSSLGASAAGSVVASAGAASGAGAVSLKDNA